MLRDEPAEPWKHRAKYQIVDTAHAGNARLTEFQNRETGAGSQHAREFDERGIRPVDVANPERDGCRVGPSVADRDRASRLHGST